MAGHTPGFIYTATENNVLCELLWILAHILHISMYIIIFHIQVCVHYVVYFFWLHDKFPLGDNKVKVEDYALACQWCSGRLGIEKIISP